MSDWERRQRFGQIDGLGIILSTAVIGFGVLVYLAIHRRSVVLLVFSVVAVIPAIVIF